MKFQRRDSILLAGVVLLALGLVPFLAPIYAMIIAAAVFFGIKAFSEMRQRQILRDIGHGICAQCGSVLNESGCPQCDQSSPPSQ